MIGLYFIIFIVGSILGDGYYKCDVESWGKFHDLGKKSCFLSWSMSSGVDVEIRDNTIKYWGQIHKMSLGDEGVKTGRWMKKVTGGFIKLKNCDRDIKGGARYTIIDGTKWGLGKNAK